ncbi:MAG: FAD-dependent oxidoreductase [Pseudomonadota bacterium]
MILIVGGGIVGLSTAYWLTRRGHDVTVIEKGPIPCPTASSADHHRLIRYPYGPREGYCLRISEAFAAWRAMWADLGGAEARYYAATGMLTLSQEAGDYADLSRQVMERNAIPFERIDGIAALSARFPFLEAANVSYGMLSEGGALMANRILADLADWLRRAGVAVLEHTPVDAIDPERASVTLGDGRTLSGETLIVAAGVGTLKLMPDLSVPLQPHRTMIAYAEPPEDLAEAYAAAPCWTDLGGNTDLWGMPAIDGLPMKLGNGTLGRTDPDDSDRTMTGDEAVRLLEGYRGRFRGVERFRVRWQQANYWTSAPDGDFVIERVGKTTAVSACSGHGFKFGALSGRDVADAVTEAVPFDTVRDRMQGRIAA